MAVNLTQGAIMTMCYTSEELQPVLQVIHLKQVQSPRDGSTGRYRLMLSDGSYYQATMLDLHKNELIHSGSLRKGSVIKLTQFICHDVYNRKIIIAIELDVILDKCDLIGEPSVAPRELPAQYATSQPGNTKGVMMSVDVLQRMKALADSDDDIAIVDLGASTQQSQSGTPMANVEFATRVGPSPNIQQTQHSDARPNQADKRQPEGRQQEGVPKKVKHDRDKRKAKQFDPSKVTFASLTKVDFEEFQQDPFTILTKVGYLGSKLLKQSEADSKMREKEVDQARQERDEALRQLKLVQDALTQTEEARKKAKADLKLSEQAKTKAMNAKAKAEEKISDLEVQVKELEPMKDRVEELEVKLKAAEVGREKVAAKIREVVTMAEEVAGSSFWNAIAQVKCMNPSFVLVTDQLNKDYEVHEGKLVEFHKDMVNFDIRVEPPV